MSHSLIDPDLLDALEHVECKPFKCDVWRVAWRTQDVLKGGQRGRWNLPPLTALYTSLDMDGAIAEVYSLLSKAPILSSADKVIYQLQVQTHSTLFLDTIDKLYDLGVDYKESPDREETIERCQRIGEAAYRLDCDSILAPSLRWNCNNLIVFSDLIDPSGVIVAGDSQNVNWPAWIETNGRMVRRSSRRFREE